MTRLYSIIVLVGLLGGILYGAKYYYSFTQAKIEQLVSEKNILEKAVETNESTIAFLRGDIERQQQLSNDLQEKLRRAEIGIDQLRETLLNHNLTRLALEKPGLIEKRINDGTKNIFDQIESDSGGNPSSSN